MLACDDPELFRAYRQMDRSRDGSVSEKDDHTLFGQGDKE